MIKILYILGAIALIFSIVFGIFSGSFWTVITSLAVGISTAVVFFALAMILENQQDIVANIKYNEQLLRKLTKEEDKICQKCSYVYEAELSSCPKCGHRE